MAWSRGYEAATWAANGKAAVQAGRYVQILQRLALAVMAERRGSNMMTHTEAQKLREEKYTLQNTLAFIRGKRGKKAEEQRVQLEARKEEIDKILEDAPPMALSPDEIWSNIEWWAKRLIKRADDLKAAFLEKFTGDPHWAFSSYGQDVIIASRMARQAKRIVEVYEGEADLQKRIEGLLQGLVYLGQELQKEIISEARSGYMRSTNSMGNLISLYEQEAQARIYDELFGGYGGLHVDSMVESYRAWQEWQKELESAAGE